MKRIPPPPRSMIEVAVGASLMAVGLMVMWQTIAGGGCFHRPEPSHHPATTEARIHSNASAAFESSEGDRSERRQQHKQQ